MAALACGQSHSVHRRHGNAVRFEPRRDTSVHVVRVRRDDGDARCPRIEQCLGDRLGDADRFGAGELADARADLAIVILAAKQTRTRRPEDDDVRQHGAHHGGRRKRELIEHLLLARRGHVRHEHARRVQRGVMWEAAVEVDLHHRIGGRNQQTHAPGHVEVDLGERVRWRNHHSGFPTHAGSHRAGHNSEVTRRSVEPPAAPPARAADQKSVPASLACSSREHRRRRKSRSGSPASSGSWPARDTPLAPYGPVRVRHLDDQAFDLRDIERRRHQVERERTRLARGPRR